jgi:hypothetical protein
MKTTNKVTEIKDEKTKRRMAAAKQFYADIREKEKGKGSKWDYQRRLQNCRKHDCDYQVG